MKDIKVLLQSMVINEKSLKSDDVQKSTLIRAKGMLAIDKVRMKCQNSVNFGGKR